MDIADFTAKLVVGFVIGFIVSWTIGLLPAIIYRYAIYKGTIEKKKVFWRLAPIVIVLAVVFKTVNAANTGKPPSGNPIPWIIIYYIGKWIMTRKPKYSAGLTDRKRIKRGCLFASGGLLAILVIGGVLVTPYLRQYFPDKKAVCESVGSDPVHQALLKGDVLEIKRLIAEGASPNRTVIKGHTPLITASRLGRIDIATILLKAGADPNHKDDLRWTPLHHAILEDKSNLAMVTLLVNSGADVNAQDSRLRTPLHRAAQFGHADIVKYLLQVGANVNAKDENGWTPLERGNSRGTVNPEVEAILKANHGR